MGEAGRNNRGWRKLKGVLRIMSRTQLLGRVDLLIVDVRDNVAHDESSAASRGACGDAGDEDVILKLLQRQPQPVLGGPQRDGA